MYKHFGIILFPIVVFFGNNKTLLPYFFPIYLHIKLLQKSIVFMSIFPENLWPDEFFGREFTLIMHGSPPTHPLTHPHNIQQPLSPRQHPPLPYITENLNSGSLFPTTLILMAKKDRGIKTVFLKVLTGLMSLVRIMCNVIFRKETLQLRYMTCGAWEVQRFRVMVRSCYDLAPPSWYLGYLLSFIAQSRLCTLTLNFVCVVCVIIWLRMWFALLFLCRLLYKRALNTGVTQRCLLCVFSFLLYFLGQKMFFFSF